MKNCPFKGSARTLEVAAESHKEFLGGDGMRWVLMMVPSRIDTESGNPQCLSPDSDQSLSLRFGLGLPIRTLQTLIALCTLQDMHESR